MAYRPFLRTMAGYGETLFGRVLLVLMFLWLVATMVRVAMGRGRPVDLVALTFALALLFTSTSSRARSSPTPTASCTATSGQPGRWPIWSSTGARLTQRLMQRWRSRHAPAAGLQPSFGLAAAAVLIGTAPIAWAGLQESRAHGGIPGWKTFNPDLRQTAFAREVNLATRPGDVLHFHASLPQPPSVSGWTGRSTTTGT